ISLKLEHQEIVSKTYLGFITYLEGVFDRDADRRAKQMMIQAQEDKKATEKESGRQPSDLGLDTQRPPSFAGGLAEGPITATQGLGPPIQQHTQNPSPTSSKQCPGYPAASTQTLAFHNYPSHFASQQQSQPQTGQTYSQYTFATAYSQGPAYQQPPQVAIMGGLSQTQAQNPAQPAWPVPIHSQGQYPHASMPTSPPSQVAP
ncbi:hypothetical protein QBC36DRAFT_150934, partial [Triangularia setosa]